MIKIYIDQGHNPEGVNSGAEGNGLREQDVTYRVGVLLAGLLDADGNFSTRLSRTTPTTKLGTTNTESLDQRVSDANCWEADYFISIHANSAENPTATGCEAYAYSTASRGYALGARILSSLSQTTGLRNRGMKLRPSLYVLRKTKMPAVLVEIGFITNPRDAALMRDDPEAFARGIYRGILTYFGL